MDAAISVSGERIYVLFTAKETLLMFSIIAPICDVQLYKYTRVEASLLLPPFHNSCLKFD